MRLVSYLRVSTNGQVDAYGLEAQRRDIRRWAKANGHKIVAEHVDAGLSGTLPVGERPGLADALRTLRKPPEADGIVAGRIDRLARELTAQEGIFALVWREGGRVFTADYGEWMRDDPDDPMRTAMRQMAGVFAQLDRASISKRLRDGIKAKAAAGKHATGSYAYGYHGTGKGRERDAAPREDEQRAVRRIVELRRAGDSYRAIAATLDAEGHQPRKAERWSAMAVRNVAVRELGE
jgi:DNA invertase Pin-like site-specific DNA recombinase